MGEKKIAIETLAQAARAYPQFWSETLTYRRLFEHSLSLQAMAAWRLDPEVKMFERVVLDGILAAAAMVRWIVPTLHVR